MAAQDEPVVTQGDEAEDTPGYVAPAKKTLDEITQQDQDDESLQKYKQQLLGNTAETVFFPEDPRQVLVNKLGFISEGRDDVELDLTGDLHALKKQKAFVIKEGASYRIRVYFYVQREIVTGLKYVQKVFRKGIKVDTNTFMVGSYGPKKELQSYTTPSEEAPSGMLSRGTYTVKSQFTDDDKNKHLEWEWSFDIKKDWA